MIAPKLESTVPWKTMRGFKWTAKDSRGDQEVAFARYRYSLF